MTHPKKKKSLHQKKNLDENTKKIGLSNEQIFDLIIDTVIEKANKKRKEAIHFALFGTFCDGIIDELFSFAAITFNVSKFCQCRQFGHGITSFWISDSGTKADITCDCIFGQKRVLRDCSECKDLTWTTETASRWKDNVCSCDDCWKNNAFLCDSCLNRCQNPDCEKIVCLKALCILDKPYFNRSENYWVKNVCQDCDSSFFNSPISGSEWASDD